MHFLTGGRVASAGTCNRVLQASEGEAAEAGDSNGAGYNPNGTNGPTKGFGMLAPPLILLRAATAVLMACVLAVGCGFAGGPDLTLGYLEWDENVAVSSLTKVLLQEELGYENVELKLADDVKPVYEMVGSGRPTLSRTPGCPTRKRYSAASKTMWSCSIRGSRARPRQA
jgi:hypothetical protein